MPAAITRPPFRTARSAAGISEPTGAKMIAASSGSGGGLSESPTHSAPKPRGEVLRLAVAGPGEGEDALALVAGDLRHDVRRGAEAVDAEGLGRARHAMRAVADQPGAEERRGIGIAVAVRDAEAVAVVGEDEVLVAAVEMAAGEARVVAEILLAGMAEAAAAAGAAEPGNADPLADGEAMGAVAHPRHLADDLVPRDHRMAAHRQLAVDEVEVGAADAAGEHPQEQLGRPGLGNRPFLEPETLSRPTAHHCPHAAHPAIKAGRREAGGVSRHLAPAAIAAIIGAARGGDSPVRPRG